MNRCGRTYGRMNGKRKGELRERVEGGGVEGKRRNFLHEYKERGTY